MKFSSYYSIEGHFDCDFDVATIKSEPMFFNCSLDFAYGYGGKITRAFIDALPTYWQRDDVVFDSRVHMLMKGWYPCIPGWHHDDVPRSTPNGQPNYIDPEYRSDHVLGLVNAEVAPTEFAEGTIDLEVPEDMIYKKWHPQVEEAVRMGNLKLHKAKSGTLYAFDYETFHQGTRAVKDGWRWFARVSNNTHRSLHITNEIRSQVQVYMEFPMEGW
jgi:hypothetical protein